MTGMLLSAMNCCTTSDVWLGALRTDRYYLQVDGDNRMNGTIGDDSLLFHLHDCRLRSYWVSCRTFQIISSVLNSRNILPALYIYNQFTLGSLHKTLHYTIHYTTQYITLHNTLYYTIHYIKQTLHYTIHYVTKILHYTIHYTTKYITLHKHYITQYITLHNTLRYTIHYVTQTLHYTIHYFTQTLHYSIHYITQYITLLHKAKYVEKYSKYQQSRGL
jgi:hypothetical protein